MPAGERSVEAKVQAVIVEQNNPALPLSRKRELLSDLLHGERVILSWAKKRPDACSAWVSITFPAFDRLSPMTARTDELPLLFFAPAWRQEGYDAKARVTGMLAQARRERRELTADLRIGLARGYAHALETLGWPDALRMAEALRKEQPVLSDEDMVVFAGMVDRQQIAWLRREGARMSPAQRAAVMLIRLPGLEVSAARRREHDRVARHIEQLGELSLDEYDGLMDVIGQVAEEGLTPGVRETLALAVPTDAERAAAKSRGRPARRRP
jgi:hypothetical protein